MHAEEGFSMQQTQIQTESKIMKESGQKWSHQIKLWLYWPSWLISWDPTNWIKWYFYIFPKSCLVKLFQGLQWPEIDSSTTMSSPSDWPGSQASGNREQGNPSAQAGFCCKFSYYYLYMPETNMIIF